MQRALHKWVRRTFDRFVLSLGFAADEAVIDFEGNADRTRKQSHSYALLGTWAHPDAAALFPFRCAIEYDLHVSDRNVSHLKTSIGKTLAHVLSGAYDAALQVYIVRPNARHGAKQYLEDESPFTRQYLERLHEANVAVAVLALPPCP